MILETLETFLHKTTFFMSVNRPQIHPFPPVPLKKIKKMFPLAEFIH